MMLIDDPKIRKIIDTSLPCHCLVAGNGICVAFGQEHIRLVGLSATLPNYEDVAVFLRVCVSAESTFLEHVETLRDSLIILVSFSTMAKIC